VGYTSGSVGEVPGERKAEIRDDDDNNNNKGNVVPVFLTEHHAMKLYWGVEELLHSFFDLGIRWRQVVSFTPRPIYPQEKSPWYPFDRRWVGLRAVLDAVVKRKNSQPPPGIEPYNPNP
jgi:hypothetical protein